MMETSPGQDFTQVARYLGQKWKQLPDSERRIFEILAYADKRRYLEAKARWGGSGSGKETQEEEKQKEEEADEEEVDEEDDEEEEAEEEVGGKVEEAAEECPLRLRERSKSKPEPSTAVFTMKPRPPRPQRGGTASASASALQQHQSYDSGSEVLKWGVLDVARFVACIGLSGLQGPVLQHGLDGRRLLQLADPEALARLGIGGELDRRKVAKAVQNLLLG